MKKRSRVDLYVVRLGVDDKGQLEYRNARPCRHCLNLMKEYGVRRVYYTTGPNAYAMEKIETMTTEHESAALRLLRLRNFVTEDSSLESE